MMMMTTLPDKSLLQQNRDILDEAETKLLNHMLKTGQSFTRTEAAEFLGVKEKLASLLMYRMRIQGYITRAEDGWAYELVPLEGT